MNNIEKLTIAGKTLDLKPVNERITSVENLLNPVDGIVKTGQLLPVIAFLGGNTPSEIVRVALAPHASASNIQGILNSLQNSAEAQRVRLTVAQNNCGTSTSNIPAGYTRAIAFSNTTSWIEFNLSGKISNLEIKMIVGGNRTVGVFLDGVQIHTQSFASSSAVQTLFLENVGSGVLRIQNLTSSSINVWDILFDVALIQPAELPADASEGDRYVKRDADSDEVFEYREGAWFQQNSTEGIAIRVIAEQNKLYIKQGVRFEADENEDTDTLYEIFDRTNNGLTPAPGGTGTTRYLREDGVWGTPPNTTYAAMPPAVAIEGMQGGTYLIAPSTLKQAVLAHAPTYGVFNRDNAGLVPAPIDASVTRFLREDGVWGNTPNTTYLALSDDEAGQGTSTEKRTITAKVLKFAIETHAPAQQTPEQLPQINITDDIIFDFTDSTQQDVEFDFAQGNALIIPPDGEGDTQFPLNIIPTNAQTGDVRYFTIDCRNSNLDMYLASDVLIDGVPYSALNSGGSDNWNVTDQSPVDVHFENKCLIFKFIYLTETLKYIELKTITRQ